MFASALALLRLVHESCAFHHSIRCIANNVEVYCKTVSCAIFNESQAYGFAQMVKQFFTTQCWLPVQEYTTQPPSNRLTDSQFSIFIVHNQYSQLRQRKDFIVNSLLLICMHLYIHFPCYCEPMTCLTLSRYKLPAACTVTLSLMCFISPFCLFFFQCQRFPKTERCMWTCLFLLVSFIACHNLVLILLYTDSHFGIDCLI